MRGFGLATLQKGAATRGFGLQKSISDVMVYGRSAAAPAAKKLLCNQIWALEGHEPARQCEGLGWLGSKEVPVWACSIAQRGCYAEVLVWFGCAEARLFDGLAGSAGRR